MPWPLARFLWGVVLAAAFAFLVIASLRLLRVTLAPPDTVAACALALGFGPLTNAFALGQVALVSCAAIAGTLWAIRSRSFGGTFAGALLAALQPNLVPVLLTQLRDRRTVAALAAAGLAALCGSFLALGPGTSAPYYSTLLAHGRAERFVSIQVTPAAVAYAFGASAPLAQGLGMAIGLGVVAFVALAIARNALDPVTSGALGSAALPLVLPFAHEADLALLFFPALLVLRRTAGALWRCALAGTILVAVDWLDLAQRTTPLVTTLVLALCAVAGALAFGRRTRRRALPARVWLVPLASLGAVLVLGAISSAHPLAVWPDALPGAFHPHSLASAAAVWQVEQRAAGLATPNPWSGFLRLLSLAGCALVAVCVAASRPDGAREAR